MSFIPRPHEIYKHFKGNLYQIVTIAEHSETGEQLVIYQALYGDYKTYARPLSMFVGKVDREKYPDVPQEFRFELQGPEDRRAERASEATEDGRTDCASKVAEVGSTEKANVTVKTEATAETTAPTVASEVTKTVAPAETTAEATASVATVTTTVAPEEAEDAEAALDPAIVEFLDADSYETRLNILAGLHHRITDEMITTMAIACDVEVGDGELESRYESLRSCLLTLEKYECNRIQ